MMHHSLGIDNENREVVIAYWLISIHTLTPLIERP